MTLPSLATVDDLGTRLGRAVDDPGQAQALLDYASSIIRAYAGELWVDTYGDLTELPDGVPQVCTEMVFRAVSNPEGVTQDTAGPFSVSFGSDAAQRIYLTKSDKTIIGRRGRAFTIDPTPAAAADFSDPWCEWSETETS